MATTYPYAAKGAPTVGKGLGGLPRRIDPVIPAPVVPPTPVGPYYLSKIGQMYNTNQTYCFSPNVTASFNFSDGSYSNNAYYLIRNSTFTYCERTYSENNRQIKTTGGNATTWTINDNPNGYVTWVHCLKHDLSGMVSLQTSNGFGNEFANTSCVETVNGVDTYYFMTFDSSPNTMSLSKVTPNYATQLKQQSADAQRSFQYSSRSRPYGMFINGDFLYVVSGDSTGNFRIFLDKFNKSDLTYVSTVYWNVTGNPERLTTGGCYAETATTLAVRYQQASSGAYARIFVIDKTTLKGYEYYNGIGGDSSWQCNLLNDTDEIYVAYGAGSGGGYGFAYVYVLRPTSIISVASQSYSGATFSLASSVRCTTPKGINWGSYFRADGVGGQNTDFKQIFVPGPGKVFGYSNSGWSFNQSWDVYSAGQTDGSPITLTTSTTANPYTAQFWSFNPLGTTYITV